MRSDNPLVRLVVKGREGFMIGLLSGVLLLGLDKFLNLFYIVDGGWFTCYMFVLLCGVLGFVVDLVVSVEDIKRWFK